MTRYTYHLSPRLLASLDVGAVIETTYLANYGTQPEGVQSETITKVSDLGIWTDKGNRYSRRTGERWGDGGSNFPRCIFQLVKAAPLAHPVQVSMERVGRKHDVRFTVNWSEPGNFEALVDAIGNRIQPMLMSSGFVLTLTQEGDTAPDGNRFGTVSLEGGRYGTGLWETVPA